MSSLSQPSSIRLPEDKPRVVGLVRVSTAAQAADGRAGLDRQREVVRRTVEARNLDCLKVYELTDVSGTSVLRNADILEILSLVKSGVIQGICLADLDRLFRPDSPSDFAILQVFKDTGAIIYSGDIEYDLGSKHGMLFSHIRSAISGYELSLMRERQQGAKEVKRRVGKCPTNHLTLPLGVGYDRKEEKFIWTPEIGLVRELFNLFDRKGITNYSELQRLTGINHASIRVILRNPIYTGWRVIHTRAGEKRVSRNGKTYRVKVPRASDEIVRVRVLDEPAVSEEVFERVQTEMARVKLNHIERHRTDMMVNLVAGTGVCGFCGSPLYTISGRGHSPDGSSRPGYYQCRRNHYSWKRRDGKCSQKHLKKDFVDEAVIGFIAGKLTEPKFLMSLITLSWERQRGLLTPFPAAGDGPLLAELDKRDKRLLEAYEAGAVSVTELRERREAIRKEREALARTAKRDTSANRRSLEEFSALVAKGAVKFATLANKLEQKKIVAALFSELHFRDRYLVSVRFATGSGMNNLEGGHASGLEQTIELSEPVLIGPAEDTVPEGHRRCQKCKVISSIVNFYKNLNTCHSCRKAEAKSRYLARKKGK